MRSLRIGVVLGGQLVEERVFTGDVTIGQSLECDLSLPIDGMPRRHTLVKDGVLHPIGKLVGDLGRGKIVIGDATILLQSVERVVAPPVKLPASLRAHHWDARVVGIVSASLAVHAVVGWLAWSADIDGVVLGARDVPQSFQQEQIDVSLPDFVERVDVPDHTGQGVAKPVTPTRQIVQPVTPPPAANRDDASRLAALLVGDEGAHGYAGMAHRAPGADLAIQMDEASHHAVTIGEDGQHTSRVDDRANIGTARDGGWAPTMPETGGASTLPHRDEKPPGRIFIQPLPGDTGTSLTAQMVLDKIQGSYMAGLQRCYRLGQAEDATLEGKITIELTVDAHGRVTEPSASGMSSKVDGCVSGMMAGWHFGIPRDKDGEATEATFRIALVLKRG
ncbi:MAG: hypothetical protein QM831_17970 [Kofleriaceae bacterium]